jgi:hypothetical protein
MMGLFLKRFFVLFTCPVSMWAEAF